MCGRFTLRASPADIAQHFGLDEIPDDLFEERFNIAPSQSVATVRLDDAGRHTLRMNKWGLIPAWSKDAKIGFSLTNARAETVAEKPAFRSAFKSKRCLIPADGFYEWRAISAKVKQPYHFARLDGGLLGLAGLWERWTNPESHSVETCTIITTTPNRVTAPVHDRMPVILAPGDYAVWLDARSTADDLLAMLKPYPADEMTAVAVSSYVSNARNQGPQYLLPVPVNETAPP
jgi:putative SOS response-associated peptidase YedK